MADKPETKVKIQLDMKVKIKGVYEAPGTILTIPKSLAEKLLKQKAGHPYKAPKEKEVDTETEPKK